MIFRCTRRKLLRRAASPDLHRWLAHTAGTRGCHRPVRLTGSLHTVEPDTGRIVESRHTSDLPDGVLYVPCGDRRASVCPPCAETYRADTYQLIRAGLVGGKGVPSIVAGHPACSPPSPHPPSGPSTPGSVNPRTGKVRPCRIRRHHHPLPARQAAGLHPAAHRERSDPGPAALPGLLRPRPPRRLERLGRRTVAPHHHHPHPRPPPPRTASTAIKLRVSFGKVAEYQRRGVVHFHALIRLDDVDPTDPDAVLAPPDGHHRRRPRRARRRRHRHHRRSAPRTTPTPTTPGPSTGAPSSTSARSGWPGTRSPPKPSPPTWPSTPPRPPNPPGCRSPPG